MLGGRKPQSRVGGPPLARRCVCVCVCGEREREPGGGVCGGRAVMLGGLKPKSRKDKEAEEDKAREGFGNADDDEFSVEDEARIAPITNLSRPFRG